jgi:hypothetical protein
MRITVAQVDAQDVAQAIGRRAKSDVGDVQIAAGAEDHRRWRRQARHDRRLRAVDHPHDAARAG